MRKVTKPKDNSSPEQAGAAGKSRNTQMLEDVEESMPTERYQTNAESAISPLEETDILCKEYISNYRKLATKTVYLQHEQQHEQ